MSDNKSLADKREKLVATHKKVKEDVKNAVAAGKQKGAAALAGRKNTVTSNRLKLLVTVVPRAKAEYYIDLIQSFDVNMQMTVLAEGTASQKTLSLLGLTDSSRAVIFSVIQEEKVPDALHSLDDKFRTLKGGKGMAFTLALTSVIGTLIFGFLSNNRETVRGKTPSSNK